MEMLDGHIDEFIYWYNRKMMDKYLIYLCLILPDFILFKWTETMWFYLNLIYMKPTERESA